ncbi:ETS homologous factor-like isoform X2 [Zophobas morio]|uniref:ETS homologous factor-like isoform X2 n=2 Tax=Zophobas morio TaxID=2755281 RepID=UPI00308289D7
MCTDLDLNVLDWDFLQNLNYTDFDMDGIINEIQNPHPKPMDQWENQEVLDFILREISMKFTDVNHNHLERFRCISGFIFKNLSEENCKLLSNSQYIGEMIFDAKEKYVRCHPTECFIDGNNYFHEANNENSSVFSNFSKVPSTSESLDTLSRSSKKPGRPRCKPFSDKNGKRSEKLWEFLLHLLRDNKTCPQLIKWENFEEGTFKFVQSNKVARLWGNRKKNENMTYEKFSRAMRYYYKSKVLLPVPGKRLVYKFGPQAKGWKNVIPIS